MSTPQQDRSSGTVEGPVADSSRSEDRTQEPMHGRALLWRATPAVAALALYAGFSGVGFLADDFLYLRWSRLGLETLLARVTIASDPQMLRPLPALVWHLLGAAQGALAMHWLSILLHAAASSLVGLLAAKRAGSPASGAVVGTLFAASPLGAEPVVWLSSSFDLWATVFCLAALWVLERATPWRICLASALFALGLASKESAFVLPVLVLLLSPRSWRPAAWLAAVAAAYLAVRVAVFSGLGGYAVAGSRAPIPAFDGAFFLRNALFQVPFRFARGLKSSLDFGPLVFTATVATTTVALSLLRSWRKLGTFFRVAGVWLVALAPTYAVLSVAGDHEGSRLVYLPAAVAWIAMADLLGVGASDHPRRQRALQALAALAGAWATVAVVNAQAWRTAGRVVESTLVGLPSALETLPAGSELLVDAPDSIDGAYVWRNGLVSAVERAGLRRDVEVRLGALGALGGDPEQRLGRDLFAIRVDPAGRFQDRTACYRELTREPGRPLVEIFLQESLWSNRTYGSYSVSELSPVGLSSPSSHLVLDLCAGRCVEQRSIEGVVEWRIDPSRPFRGSDGAEILVPPGGRTVVLLPPFEAATPEIALRFALTRPSQIRCLQVLRLRTAPASCS